MDHDTRPQQAVTAPGGEQTAATRLLAAVLPPRWSVIGRCRQGTALPSGGPTGCHVLAHPEVGLALLDVAPDTTPNAEARLRRVLAASGFPQRFPGTLPIWHGRIEPTELRLLPPLLEAAFAAQPSLTLDGGQVWVTAVREALDAEPAWEAANRPKRAVAPPPMPDEPEPEEEEAPPNLFRRVASAGRRLSLGLVLGTVFALGVMAGYALQDDPDTELAMPATAARADPEPTMPAAPVQADPVQADPEPLPAAAPLATPPAEAEAPAPLWTASPRAGTGLETLTEEETTETETDVAPSLSVVTETPATPADATASASPAEDGLGLSGDAASLEAPAEAAIDEDLPLPPAALPAPPPKVARYSPRYDRQCSTAIFRWQRGERLSAAEMAHVREGCAMRRQ